MDAFSGLRSGEVTGLHVEDVDFERGAINVQRSIYRGREVPTKGKRNRTVFIDSITVQMIQKFLGGRTTGRIFNSRMGTPICNQQLNVVLTWATAKLGIKRGSMHAFRHGRVSLLRKDGTFSDKVVQDQVGHQNIRTTNKYTHAEEAEIREKMEKIATSCAQPPTLCANAVAASSSQ